MTAYGRAAAVYEKLGKAMPDDPRHVADLADVNLRWASLPSENADFLHNRKRAEHAHEQIAALVTRYPDRPEFRALEARSQSTLAQIFDRAERPREAEEHYVAASKSLRSLIMKSTLPPPLQEQVFDDFMTLHHSYTDFLIAQDARPKRWPRPKQLSRR